MNTHFKHEGTVYFLHAVSSITYNSERKQMLVYFVDDFKLTLSEGEEGYESLYEEFEFWKDES